MAALQGQPVLPQQEQMQEQQVQQEPASIPPTTPPPVNNVSMETPPVGQDSLVNSFSNTSPQIQDLPTGSAEPQLLKTGGIKSHGGLHTAEASSTAVAPVNIPTIIEAETDQERMIRLASQKNTGTIYDPSIGNNPNKQWISGASNQMYASSKQKQKSQDYGETVLGFAAPIPLLNSMKVSASGAKIPGLIDDVILGPIGKGYGVLKNLFKKNNIPKPKTKPSYPKSSILRTADVSDEIPKLSELDKLKIAKIKDSNIKRLRSDDYISKRMANTGESRESIIRQIDEYVDELEIAPIKFKGPNDPKMTGVEGYYQHPAYSTSKSGEIAIKRGLQKHLSTNTFGVIDHEIKHLLSPAGKFDKSSPLYKEALEEADQLDKIQKKLSQAVTSEQADKAVAMYAKIKGIQPAKMDKVYKNYPTLDINKTSSEFKYMSKPAEQQVRLLRGADWFKRNYKWDGTKAGMSDDMLKDVFDQMSNYGDWIRKNKGIKETMPGDFRELLKHVNPNTTYDQLRNVISKAWALGPVAVGAGAASEKRLGGFDDPQEKLEIDYSKTPEKKKKLATTGNETSYRQHMMNYLYDAGADTSYANIAMNAIGEHESRNIANRKQDSYKYVQLPPDLTGKSDSVKVRYDGPGRGAYQYEIGEEEGASTGMNRNATFTRDSTARTFNQFPTIFPEAKKVSPDFSKLSREDQDGLFLGDKMNRNKSAVKSFYKLIAKDGTPPTQEEVFQFWLKNHKQSIGKTKIKNATPAQIEKERKAWNSRTKDMFKKGGKKKGSDGRACWDGYRYAGTENGKDKCVPFEYGGFKKKCKYGCW
tara:strand:- start:62 stop:2503 length:2442 start_codon:yes stop_codon:yes gene_type:complete